MNYLETHDVVKRYADHLALDGVSISVPRGGIYGLLGPNGAGKTTLIRIINRIIALDAGEVLFDGRPMTAADVARIGYLPEERGLYKKMRVGEQVEYLARLKGLSRDDARRRTREWLERFGLDEWRKHKLEELSKGMQQKIQFIATVIHEPSLIILDEPFSGFDPVNAEFVKREIHRLRDAGATLILSTHNMASVEELCDEISLINRARVVLQGEVDAIRRRHSKNLYRIRTADGDPVGESGLFEVEELIHHHGNTEAIVRMAQGMSRREAIVRLAERCDLLSFEELLPSMQEIFIETVNNASPAEAKEASAAEAGKEESHE
jgi:ABC-2 type transport system ATP-binding protein